MALLPIDSLPLGFRFRPTDEELVNYYLIGKICGRRCRVEVIPEVDVCKCEPWDLPDKSIIRNDDPEWFFFSARDRKYPNGHRSNRATEAGYWKATGKDRKIKSRSEQIGTKKTLVFYRGRAPAGERTNWIMHEYRANEKGLKDYTGPQDAFVLCRLFKKTEEKTENPNCDLVDPSGFSPATSKSSPEDLPMDTEDPALKNGSPHLAEGPQLPQAVTESDEVVDIDKWLAELLDNGTPDRPTQNDLKCNNYMEGPDQDAPGPPFDPKFHSSDSNAALMSSNSGSLHDDWYQTGNLGPFQDTSVEQNDSYVDPTKLWEQWLNLSGDEYTEELPNNSIEAVDDTGITIRSRKPQQTNSDNFSLQGSAPRRIRLQRNMLQRCYPDSDNEAEAEEAPEARQIILEPVNDAKPESLLDQVVTPANRKHIHSLTRRQPKAKAAKHQDASSSLGAKKEPAESKPSKNSIDKASSYLQQAAVNSKTRPRLAIKFCLALFIIVIIILITAVWRENKS